MKISTASMKSLLPVFLFSMTLGGGVARATVIFNSLDETTTAGFYPIAPGGGNGGPLGASFLTGASASTLSSVSVFLYDPSGATTGSFSISLFSNSGSNTPGTLLETLATPSDSILPGAGTFGAFTYSGLSYVLAANTEYWIELSGANSHLGWEGTSDTSGIGVSGQYFYDNGGSFSNSQTGPQQMTINTSAFAAVPEPSALFLCGLLGGVAFFHRRSAK